MMINCPVKFLYKQWNQKGVKLFRAWGVDFSANWHSNTCFDVRLIINYKSQCRTSQLFVYKINMPNEECILSSIPYLIIICTVWDSWLISLLINQSHGLLIMYLSWACQLSHCLSLIQKKKLLHKTSFKLNILYKEKKSLCLECSEDFKEKDHI